MAEFFRKQLFNIIAAVFLALFVIVWGSVLAQVWVFVPEVQGGNEEAAVQARAGTFDAGGITTKLSGRVIAALMVYLVIGLLVLGVWLVKGTASTDLIGAFSLSLLGWIIGAAGVVFQTEKPGAQAAAAGQPAA